MNKKIVFGLAATSTALAMLPLFAAFEAHVVNVTAQIENALAVSTAAIEFGTVFPQEHLNKSLDVRLSSSFLTEGRVDDVNYFIRQKPKCALTNEAGTEIIGPTATGHIILNGQGGYTIDCGPAPLNPTTGQPLPGHWGVLPSLCEYISKEDDKTPDNDGSTASFHEPFQIVNNTIQWLDTHGRLAKSENDLADNWTIDLAVPCFGGFCAQDWENFVHGINPGANPADYTQPIANEHKVFDCDLWVEVSGVSPILGEITLNPNYQPDGYVHEVMQINYARYVAGDVDFTLKDANTDTTYYQFSGHKGVNPGGYFEWSYRDQSPAFGGAGDYEGYDSTLLFPIWAADNTIVPAGTPIVISIMLTPDGGGSPHTVTYNYTVTAEDVLNADHDFGND